MDTNPIFGNNKISFQWVESFINFSAISNTISKNELTKLFIEKQKHAYEINRLKLKKYHPYLDQIITCLEELHNSLPNQVSHKLIKLLNVVETIYIKSKNDILTLEKIKETIVKITKRVR